MMPLSGEGRDTVEIHKCQNEFGVISPTGTAINKTPVPDSIFSIGAGGRR